MTYGGYSQFDFTGRCHLGQRPVMRIGKSTIVAGRFADMKDRHDWSLRIRLSDSEYMRIDTMVTANEEAWAILPQGLLELKQPPTLDIEWQDYQAPDLSREWWMQLVSAIRKLPKGQVGIYCYGGHGRTGTALAILASLSGVTKQKDPIAFVRKKYCSEAVESWSQLAYIRRITGVKIDSLPASTFKKSSYGTGPITPSTTVLDPNNVQTDDTKPYGNTIPPDTVEAEPLKRFEIDHEVYEWDDKAEKYRLVEIKGDQDGPDPVG